MIVVERQPRASQGGQGRAFSQWRGDIPEDSFLPECGGAHGVTTHALDMEERCSIHVCDGPWPPGESLPVRVGWVRCRRIGWLADETCSASCHLAQHPSSALCEAA